MFSFHKPKIYRSLKGCCICRAKSSSSRFTDSKRYEPDFEKCFWIEDTRTGEICNACVLLVKRWKKLPPGSNRNWHHVVDARAGPGTKSILKIKSRSNQNKEQQAERPRPKKKHKHKKIARPNKAPQSPGGLSDDVLGEDLNSENSGSYTSPDISDLSDDDTSVHSRKDSEKGRRKKQAKPMRFSSFLDLNYWKKTEVCCGIIFKGPNGEVMVDTSLLRPCRKCKTPPVAAACASSATLPQAAEATSALTPQALEGSSAPGSPMEAESAATIAPSATDNSILMASASPTPSSAMVTAAQLRVPTPTSLAISTAVSAVLDLSMPVTRPQTTVIMNSSSNVPSSSTVRKNSAAPINLTHQHRCIEMEV